MTAVSNMCHSFKFKVLGIDVTHQADDTTLSWKKFQITVLVPVSIDIQLLRVWRGLATVGCTHQGTGV